MVTQSLIHISSAFTQYNAHFAFNTNTDWERTSQHPINTRDSAVAALSDAQFVAPLVRMGDLLSPPAIQAGQEKTGPKCFFYVFDYQTKDGDYPQVRANGKRTPH